MKSILITGCNRGLGLGIVKELLKLSRGPQKIIATCRDLEKATELNSLAKEHKNLNIVKLDVTKLDTYQDFYSQVEALLPNGALNVLFNNAGYSPKFTRLSLVKPEQLLETFQINTVAPIILSKALLPLLKKAAEENASEPLGPSRALIVNMTSMLGSLALNDSGGLYPYRCSKVALNMATKNMSIELKKDGIIATCIHPGWVKTDMGGNNAPLDVGTSAAGIVKVLMETKESQNGKFIQYDGAELPW